jgi:hypothetical protein
MPFIPVAESEAVEAGRRRDDSRGGFTPEPRRAVCVLEHEIRHAKKRLSQHDPADAARDLVVARRRRGFAR